VLLPVRDGAATLDAALDSVLGQTLPALEVVAVDDGSGDDSAARLAAWAGRDPRVRVLRRAAA
jgi:glycosyltransferase involved in cell wall biosynthesis